MVRESIEANVCDSDVPIFYRLYRFSKVMFLGVSLFGLHAVLGDVRRSRVLGGGFIHLDFIRCLYGIRSG